MKMHKDTSVEKGGRTSWVRKVPSPFSTRLLAGWFVMSCLFAAGVGCKSADKKDDPLFGVKPPTVNPVPPTTGANLGTPNRGVPPIPDNTSAGSTAALASLPGGKALAINNPQAPAPPPTSPTGPTVQPIPRDVPASTPNLLATGSWTPQTPGMPTSLPAPSSGNFVDPQLAALQARGISNPKIENIPEGVRVTVLAPTRGTPDSLQLYTATAGDTAGAVQAILQQIDQQR